MSLDNWGDYTLPKYMLDADSLDLVDLISAIEYEFDIEANDDAIEKISTVEDVVNCVMDFTNED